MYIVLKQSWALLLGILLLMLCNSLQGSLLGVRGSLENIDSSTMGFIMAGYFVGFLGGSKLTPLMLQQVGHIRVFAALGTLVSAAFILYAAVVNVYAWWMLRVVVGFCFSGLYVVAESWLNHSASNESRGRTLSVYMIVQMAGMVIGQLLLNVADPAGYNLFILITVLVSVSIAPILLTVSSSAPVDTAVRPMSLRELFTTSPLASVGMLLLGGIYSALYAMSPVYATERGLSVSETSYFITGIFFGAMLFQFPVGWLSDKFDRRLLIVFLTAIGAAVSLVCMHAGQHLPILFVGAVILGGTSNPLYSLLVAYANDYLETDQMAAAAGGLLFMNGFGAMFGPVLVGYAMSHLGIEWYFITLFLLTSAICLYGVFRMSRRPHTVTDEAGAYLPITASTTGLGTGYALEAAEDETLDRLEEYEETFEDSRLADAERETLDKPDSKH
ncbi:MAG: MFS transporter [Granulosicoccus sp.]